MRLTRQNSQLASLIWNVGENHTEINKHIANLQQRTRFSVSIRPAVQPTFALRNDIAITFRTDIRAHDTTVNLSCVKFIYLLVISYMSRYCPSDFFMPGRSYVSIAYTLRARELCILQFFYAVLVDCKK